MKSRITIEVDFNEGNLPIIQVISQNSDDVRDRLLSSFLQSLQHTSRWCKITYVDEIPVHGDEYARFRWHISPIKPDSLPSEMELMNAIITAKDSVHSSGADVDYHKNRPFNRLDLMSPTEKYIYEAIEKVEEIGASEKLTEAVILLDKARSNVYGHYMSTEQQK